MESRTTGHTLETVQLAPVCRSGLLQFSLLLAAAELAADLGLQNFWVGIGRNRNEPWLFSRIGC